MDVSDRTPRKSESDRPRLQVSKFHVFNQSSQRLLLLSIQTSFDSRKFEALPFSSSNSGLCCRLFLCSKMAHWKMLSPLKCIAVACQLSGAFEIECF